MPEQALYLKWRPVSFDSVVGQDHITRTLRNSLKTGRIRHAYLFSGPRGTGKTTTARLLAKAVNCTNSDPELRPCNDCPNCLAVNEGRFLDLIEIDAASHTGVDDVRELRDRIAFSPGEGRYRVYIIDEVHRFSGNAFDALLKTLEEPPEHALFVLATTEIDKVPATIKSRCLPFEFRRLSLREMTERLAEIAESEGLNIEPAALELIAREGTGSARDSISLLDQVVADPSETITLALTQRILGTASARSVRELVDALVKRDVAQGLHIINAAIDSGSDPKQFGQQLVEHLRSVMLVQTASADLLDVSSDDQQRFTAQAAAISRGALLKAIRAFNDAVNSNSGGWQPQLALELALIDSLQEPEAVQQVYVPAPAAQATQPASAGQAAPAAFEPDEPVKPSEPGAPPVIPVQQIREKWLDLQKAIYRYNPNLPPMLDHAQARAVDGNRLIVVVANGVFLQKLNDPKRKQIIERALFDVHQQRMVIQVVLADAIGGGGAESGPVSAGPSYLDDPLVQAGLELGGQIHEDES